MKEFKYSEWDNRPREMWVWDTKNGADKHKEFVVYIDINKVSVRVLSKHSNKWEVAE